jgi:hypothetical protein
VRIVGNLDVEATWARLDAAARSARGERAPSPNEPRFATSEPALQKISALATLLRVFATGDDDELWTPRPVDPQRVMHVSWLPRPQLTSGPLPEDADLWWGDPSPVAARVNHRSLVQEVRSAAGCEVAAATIVRTVAELRERAAACGPWVAKAPHSAAGRLRVRGERGTLAGPALRQAEGLLDLYGALLFEPWFERRGDLGISGHVDSRRVELEAPHILHVDDSGRFRGIGVSGPLQDAGRIAQAAGVALRAYDYEGPFGVDLYLAAEPNRDTRLHLSEVNARFTFGHVAHALAKRARAALLWNGSAPITLRIGRGSPPQGTVPILGPGGVETTSAWLDIES